MKESAYKIYTRQFGGRFFAPLKFNCTILTGTRGRVDIDQISYHTTTRSAKNYIYNAEDSYKLIELIDPKWQGALPYTLLIEPNGKVIYAKQSTIDPLDLKRRIVENPAIGRVY